MSFTLKKNVQKSFYNYPNTFGRIFISEPPKSRLIIANSLNNFSMFFYESVKKKDYGEWIIDIKRPNWLKLKR